MSPSPSPSLSPMPSPSPSPKPNQACKAALVWSPRWGDETLFTNDIWSFAGTVASPSPSPPPTLTLTLALALALTLALTEPGEEAAVGGAGYVARERVAVHEEP